MKNILTILLFICMHAGMAQIQKGTIVVGGGLSLGGNSNEAMDGSNYNYNNGNFNLKGSYEKFLNDKMALGFGLDYRYVNSTFSNSMNDSGTRQHLINVGPKLSYYIPIVEKFYFTIESHSYFGIGGSKDKDSDEKYSLLSFGLSAGPGVVLFLNDKWALNAGIGSLYYNFLSEKAREENALGEKPKEIMHNYGLNVSANSFSIGLRYYLRTANSN
jgi:hypothetical protein